MHSTTPAKTCTQCHIQKPATPEFFYRQKVGKHGVHSRCKECAREDGRTFGLPEIRECEVCGSGFGPKRAGQKTCGRGCARTLQSTSNQQLARKACSRCGTSFLPRMDTRKYCGPVCGKKGKERAQKQLGEQRRVSVGLGKDNLLRLVVGERRSMQEVSALLGVSPAHVNQQCRRHGITTANYPSIIEVQRERQGQSSDKWSPEAKSKHSAYMSERNREMWQDPEMKERIAAKISEAIANGRYGRSPNNLESFFDEITSDDVRFVGDGSWWRKIDNRHRNPDFKVTGQPKVIELFGDYWHRDDDPEQVVKEYASAGLACLVFWESEVYEQTEDVLRRTEEFIAS